jgi:hypothetical protein
VGAVVEDKPQHYGCIMCARRFSRDRCGGMLGDFSLTFRRCNTYRISPNRDGLIAKSFKGQMFPDPTRAKCVNGLKHAMNFLQAALFNVILIFVLVVTFGASRVGSAELKFKHDNSFSSNSLEFRYFCKT